MTCQTHQFDTWVHLPLSEWFESIQYQERLEAIAETPEERDQTVPLTEIIPKDITLEICPSLRDLQRKVLFRNNKVVGNALQTSIDSLLVEDQDPISGPFANNNHNRLQSHTG